MDTIEYHCPIHGLVARRGRDNFTITDDLQRCPVELDLHRSCGRPLFFEFAADTSADGRIGTPSSIR